MTEDESQYPAIPLNQIAPYLPYRLKCQYEGIINGKELAEQERQFKKNGLPFDFTVNEERGLKTGILKEVLIFKNYWRAYIGNHGRALKLFTNGYSFKPLLKPLTDFNNSEADTEIFDLTGYYISVHPDFNDPVTLGWQIVDILCKHHFDVFGLINHDLAIPISTPNQ